MYLVSRTCWKLKVEREGLILVRRRRQSRAGSAGWRNNGVTIQPSHCCQKSRYLRLRHRAKRGRVRGAPTGAEDEVMRAAGRIGMKFAVLSGLVLALAAGASSQ